MKPGALWPIAIVGVLAITVGANVYLFMQARDPRAVAIEPDYYRKAVAWDSTMAQSQFDADLGWNMDASIGPVGPGGALVTATVGDSTGAAVAGASVHLEAINNIDATHHTVADLAETAPGRYAATVPLPRAGLWELRFTVRRGEVLFTESLRRDAAAGAKP